MKMECTISALKGKIIESIIGLEAQSEHVKFCLANGAIYDMIHEQECCESLWIADVCGDVADLIGSEILLAEDVSNDSKFDEDLKEENCGIDVDDCDSYTWTFYKLSTIKGSVTIRWFGQSNGWYCEVPQFYKSRLEHNYAH